MTDTLIKPVVNLDWMDAPIESDNWINLYFLVDGRSFEGKKVFTSEQAAKKSADYTAKQAEFFPEDIEQTPIGLISLKEFSHAIQMPMKDKK